MKESNRQWNPRALRAWILAVALTAALPYALKIAADNDLWWHARTGQLILEQRELPASDPFSFTATGSTWINHEWFSDVTIASIYALGGDRGLSLWRTLMLVAVMAVLTALLWRRLPHPLFVLPGVLLAAPLVRILVNLRPHSYTYLFALILLWILEAAPRRARLLWIVPPLVALWANFHGGFVLGLGMLGVVLAFRWWGLEDDSARPGAAERRRMLAVGALSMFAPVINPYGLRLFGYLTRELGANHSLIMEWQGIWSFPEYRVHFLLLCAIPVVTLLLARRLRPVAPLALLAVSTAATWVHGRFLILLVFFSCLATFSALAALLRRHPRVANGSLLQALRHPRWAWAICAVPLVAACLQFGADVRRKGLRLEIDPWNVPIEACEFLRRHDLGPNLLLRFDWGGYAIWHLYPRYKVSGDGRNLTVYDDEFVDGLLRAYRDGRFLELTRAYEVDVILTESAGPTFRELLARQDWVPVHQDRVAAVFVRPDPARSLGHRSAAAASIQPATGRFYFP